MLNLIIIGFGSMLEIQKMITTIQEILNEFIKNYNANIYDLDSLWKGENNLQFLNRKQTLILPTSKGVIKEYWGMMNPINYELVHFKWFSEKIDNNQIKNIYYSKNNLRLLINELFADKYSEVECLPYDFSISYQFGNTALGKTFCIAGLCVCENAKCNMENIIEYYQHFISILDETHPNTFVSAYISKNAPYFLDDYSLLNRFDFDALKNYILSVEYSFYMCTNMCHHEIPKSKLESLDYLANYCKNGILYVYKPGICNFDQRVIDSACSYFRDITIPSYGVYNWSYLCNLKKQYNKKPEMISIYYNKYSPTNPTIVFSYRYTSQQLDALPILSGLTLQERYIQRSN